MDDFAGYNFKEPLHRFYFRLVRYDVGLGGYACQGLLEIWMWESILSQFLMSSK